MKLTFLRNRVSASDKLQHKNHLHKEFSLLTRLCTEFIQTNLHSSCLDILCGSICCVGANDITDQVSRSKQNKNRKQ